MPDPIESAAKAMLPVTFKPCSDGVQHLSGCFLSGLRWCVLVCSSWWLLPNVAVRAQSVHWEDAVEPTAELSRLTDGGWEFRLPGGALKTGKALVRWGAWPGVIAEPAVWLSDGSWLAGALSIEPGPQLMVDSKWLQVPAIDLARVRGLVFVPPPTTAKWVELEQQMRSVTGGQDVVWLRKRQRISGVIRWPHLLPGQPANRLVLDTGTQSTEIDMLDVQAIVFSPTLLGPLPTAVPGSLGLRDGSLLRARQTELEGGRVVVQLAAGLSVESLDVAEEFAGAVTLLSGPSDAAALLTNQPPASYRHVADTQLQWELGVNRDVRGLPLRLEEGLVPQGLAMHSASQVAFRWDQSPGRLLAEARLAPARSAALSGLGSVACRVLVARNGQLEAVESFSLARGDTDENAMTGRMLDVDISGAQLIVLVVEQDGFQQYGDQVFWLDARVAAP